MTGTAQAARSTAKTHRGWSRYSAGSILRTLRGRLSPFPVHPLFIAAYPILLTYSDNRAEVALSETFRPILAAMTAAITITLVTGLFLLDLRRGALIASVLAALWLGWQLLLQPTALLGATVTIGAAVIICLALMAVASAMLLPERLIASITSVANALSIALVALVVVNVAPHELRAVHGPVPLADRQTADPGSRDVWFLVFDRYGSDEAMSAAAGVDNDLTGWLEDQGFEVAREARANYGRTSLSLSATLNMTHLDGLAATMGPDSNDAVPLTDMLRDHKVGRFLQDRGYRYVHVGSWFGPTRTSAIADENPVMPGRSDFGTMLHRTSFAPFTETVLGSKDPPPHDLLHREAALFGWDQLGRLSEEGRADPDPRFVFGHILLPHEPYVFQANGDYSALSILESASSPEAHRQQLAYTNGQIRSLVSGLLAVSPEEQPIIIVAADEGPYPERYADDEDGFDWTTATDAELTTKYGVLMAMYLPGDAPEGAPAPYADMTVINTFPMVLDRYFGQHIELLPDRSFSSRSWSRPYDLTDITDRLDDLGT